MEHDRQDASPLSSEVHRDPGELHGLAFAYYRRVNSLTYDLWRRYPSRGIDSASAADPVQLVTFIVIREQVYLFISQPGN